MKRMAPALIVSLLASAAILASARSNRAGLPTSMVTLTERELTTNRRSDRDSSRRLSLQITQKPGETADEPSLSDSALRSLGIRCTDPDQLTSKYSWANCGLARRGFVAIEFDGPEWQKISERLRGMGGEERQRAPTPEAFSYNLKQADFGTRLVVVDASPDAVSLRARYPETARYVILPAVIRASRYRRPPGDAVVTTVDVRPLVSTVVVPKSAGTDRLPPSNDCYMCNPPRYRARLLVGQRYEPWVDAIEPIDSNQVPH